VVSVYNLSKIFSFSAAVSGRDFAAAAAAAITIPYSL
jgi:hypothetical protein